MLTHPTHERLIALGLTGMAKALEEQRRQSEFAARSLGGSDDPSNLVELTFREHKASSPPGKKLKGFSGGPALAG